MSILTMFERTLKPKLDFPHVSNEMSKFFKHDIDYAGDFVHLTSQTISLSEINWTYINLNMSQF